MKEVMRMKEEPAAPFLRQEKEGLTLYANGMSLRGDLSRMKPRMKSARLRSELLIKAARIRNKEGTLTAVDATAGLGEDAFLLAAAGWQVYLCEKDPLIGALL